MARVVRQVSGEKCRSLYNKTTFVVVCVNLMAALYVVRSLYASYYILSSTSAFDSSASTVDAPLYTDEQIEIVKESIAIREASEPVELVKMVKKLKNGLYIDEQDWVLPQPVKQKLTSEILQRFKELGKHATTAMYRETLQKWHDEKLQEVKNITSGHEAFTSSIPLPDARSLQRVLESDWQMVLESLGLWMPVKVINKKTNETEDDIGCPFQINLDFSEEEYVIPGPPLPPECHTEIHTDYSGAAVRWGLSHHKETAADCCKACLDQAKRAKPGEMKCNIWVYCPSERGCYSPDRYPHRHQECWLKQDEKPRLNFKGRYSETFRNYHPTAPLLVPWISGVVG